MLRRHQLVWLDAAGWSAVRSQPRDPEAAECVAHWADQHLPLVVTRQGPDTAQIALGLPAPARWHRRRFALSVPRDHVATLGAFPLAREIVPMLPAHVRDPWVLLCNTLMRLSVVTRVHGSHGWEVITGERHVRAGSDIDLHIAVGSVGAPTRWSSASRPRRRGHRRSMVNCSSRTAATCPGASGRSGGAARWPR